MVKTKMFTDLVNDIDPSVQINRFGWRKGRGYLPDGRRMRGYVK